MDTKKEVKARSFLSHTFSMLYEKIAPKALAPTGCFLLSFIFSRGVLLGGCAPLGISATAVFGATRSSVVALCGSVLGYLSMLEYINSLKYIACIILVFTAYFVFSGTTLIKSRAFMPIAIALPFFCVNLVFIADGGFAPFDCLLSVFEVMLTILCAFLLLPVSELSQGRFPTLAAPALLTLLLCFILSFFRPEIGFFSLGRAIACTFTLLIAFSGGTGAGAVCGTLFGAGAALAFSDPSYCMLYGIGGIFSGIFKKKKLLCATLFPIPLLLLTLCFNSSLLLSVFSEILVAELLFFLFAEAFSRKTQRHFSLVSKSRDAHIRSFSSEKLLYAAEAFRGIGSLIGSPKQEEKKEKPELSSLFSSATKKLCSKCTLSGICWKRDFEATRDAINKAISATRDNGVLSAKDFPIYFSSRCLHIEDLVNSVNREIFAIKYGARYNEKVSESSSLLSHQFSDVYKIFSSVSADISDSTRFLEEAEFQIHAFLESRGILCDCAVYKDRFGHTNIHLCGRDLSIINSQFEKFYDFFTSTCGVRFSKPSYSRTETLDDILIRQRPELRAVFAAAVRRKTGSETSGDSGSFFHPENGHAALLISDGMGSGKLAAAESAAIIKMLENLLRSGLRPEDALSTLQTALIFNAEKTGSFSTLDLMYADLFNKKAEFYKFGAAPTYIKRGKKLHKINASSLPAGATLNHRTHPDKTCLPLCEGDFIIMTSDGINDSGNSEKLLDFLSASEETSPKKLADEILAFSLAVYEKNDDMTVAVVKIEKDE